tara:strand:+ start:378 stop:560 length:183 start_codon:yes stop_codon:yes gene_type:complete
MAKITESPFDIEDHTAHEVAEFWVEHHKKFTDNHVEYLEELIFSLEYARDFFKRQDNEQS